MGIASTASEQGLRRKQEDRCLVHKFSTNKIDGWLLAVFDGHGGEMASEYCHSNIAKHFTPPVDVSKIQATLQSTVARLARETAKFHPGTTLSAACIVENHDVVTVAVIGDSPIILANTDGLIWHSPKHNVGVNKKERDEAIARGASYDGDGYIGTAQYTDGGLQLSRSLGDAPFRSILSDIPDMYTMQKPSFVLITSDGIVDLTEDSQQELDKVADIARRAANPTIGCLDILAWRSKQRPLNDNATIVLWKR